ncbi:sensor histidine kinase [Marinobacter bohaiensis]|uniref:sensor histidine kinase n=1 Tax=Marinobacter bohaiensis TaxID=2201898 RepID=UPI000DAC996F|nr:sensor histidine kinase [Marinobacter bohaiensis]
MNRRLLWKLCGIITLGTLALFWTISLVGSETEHSMSFIDEEHQVTLQSWGRRAEALYVAGDEPALARWLDDLQRREDVWAAVVRSDIRPVAGSYLSEQFLEGFRLGRHVEWKIHLYFADNPIMDVTFADGKTHFLVTLPQRMRPGTYLPEIILAIKVGLPLIVLLIISVVLYRHLVGPLKQLEAATRQFSEGNLGVRVRALLGSRNDELASLAATFDRMAERTGELILSQRRLIADLSHELRTPLTRVEMAVSCAEEGMDSGLFLPRIRQECLLMRNLVEDALTLAWLENEKPTLDQDDLDLTDLLDAVLDNARYEFPGHRVDAGLPDEAPVSGTSARALDQALENVIRNALTHTPEAAGIRVTLQAESGGYRIDVDDEGPGLPEDQWERIFTPFFRASNAVPGRGFGLGLALACRQVEAAGGSIRASCSPSGGLRITLWLPRERHRNLSNS